MADGKTKKRSNSKDVKMQSFKTKLSMKKDNDILIMIFLDALQIEEI